MRHRIPEGCGDPKKLHLWRLPDIPAEKFPESYEEHNTDILVIIPIFTWQQQTNNLEHHIVRSGCWARRSWINHTDAVERGIKIAFYVGDKAKETAFPILEANGINTETQVCLFAEDPFDTDPLAMHLGKKLACFNDSRFTQYKWLLQADTDLFIASKLMAANSTHRERLNFFEYLDKRNLQPSAVWTAPLNPAYYVDIPHTKKSFPNIETHHWWYRFSETLSDPEKVSEWMKRARTLVDPTLADTYQDATVFNPTCHGGIYAFPMRAYHETEEGRRDCRWLLRAGQVLQDDEAVFSLWMMMGKALGSLCHEMNVPFFTSLDDFMRGRDQPGTRHYFSHIDSLAFEWWWREDIDAMCTQ